MTTKLGVNGAGFHEYEEIYPVADSEEELIDELTGGDLQEEFDQETRPDRRNKSDEGVR